MSDRIARGHLDAADYERYALAAAAHIAPGQDLTPTLFGFNLIRVGNRVQRDLEATIHRPAGVSWAAFRILFALRAVGPSRTGELARLSGVTVAATSSLLATLEQHEYITRTPVEGDRRAALITLTPTGDALAADLYRRNRDREAEWAAGLSEEELTVFIRLIRKLLAFHPDSPTPPVHAEHSTQGSAGHAD